VLTRDLAFMTRFVLSTAWLLGMFISTCTTAFSETKVLLPHGKKFAEVGRDFMVQSTIPGDFKTPEGITAALLTLAEQVVDKDLMAPFQPSTLKSSSHYEGALPLAAYFRGARLDGTTIVVSFSKDGLRYLNNAIGIQEPIKKSIEGTLLLNFPEAKAVTYEIDGKLFSDWDA
jgi:hypothetical protein